MFYRGGQLVILQYSRSDASVIGAKAFSPVREKRYSDARQFFRITSFHACMWRLREDLL